jgi:hypothetical protein
MKAWLTKSHHHRVGGTPATAAPGSEDRHHPDPHPPMSTDARPRQGGDLRGLGAIQATCPALPCGSWTRPTAPGSRPCASRRPAARTAPRCPPRYIAGEAMTTRGPANSTIPHPLSREHQRRGGPGPAGNPRMPPPAASRTPPARRSGRGPSPASASSSPGPRSPPGPGPARSRCPTVGSQTDRPGPPASRPGPPTCSTARPAAPHPAAGTRPPGGARLDASEVPGIELFRLPRFTAHTASSHPGSDTRAASRYLGRCIWRWTATIRWPTWPRPSGLTPPAKRVPAAATAKPSSSGPGSASTQRRGPWRSPYSPAKGRYGHRPATPRRGRPRRVHIWHDDSTSAAGHPGAPVPATSPEGRSYPGRHPGLLAQVTQALPQQPAWHSRP